VTILAPEGKTQFTMFKNNEVNRMFALQKNNYRKGGKNCITKYYPEEIKQDKTGGTCRMHAMR
jgi:RecA-family ATPase